MLFPIIMEIVVIFYSYGTCEFDKIIQLIMKGTYFKNKNKA